MAIGLEELKSKKRPVVTDRPGVSGKSDNTRPWEIADRFEEMSGQYKYRRSHADTSPPEVEKDKQIVGPPSAQLHTEFLLNPLDLERPTPGTGRGLIHLLSLSIKKIIPFSFFD